MPRRARAQSSRSRAPRWGPPAGAVVLALLLASCSSEESPSCPGTPVGLFTFTGGLTPDAPGLDPEPDLTTCSWDPGFPTTIVFSGTLAGDPDGSAAALCRDGPVYFGTHAGARWVVESSSDGAVLGRCGSTCAARSRTIVAGDVGPDPSAPTAFQGALVEQLTRSAGDCGGCVLPCAARYALTGAREAP